MPFKDCICFQLGKTMRRVTKSYRQEIAAHGLTHGQFFMMVAIMEEEGLLPSELAQKTAQDRATTTGLLDRLEKEGWILRRYREKDRRSHKIILTPFAREKKETILSLFEQTNQKYLSNFSQEEWDQLQNFLGRLDLCDSLPPDTEPDKE